jgi:hypothetical protein
MAENKRDGSGRFQGDITESDVVAAVRSYDPAATSEVADELGIERQSADYRLRKLRDTGDVCSKKIGASLVWYLPRERGQGGSGPPIMKGGFDPDPDPTTEDEDAAPDDIARTNTAELAFDTPAGVDHEVATKAIDAAVSAIETEGSLPKREIVRRVMPEYPLKYDYEKVRRKLENGDRYRGAWWRKVIKPGLQSEGFEYENGEGWVRE